MRWLNSLAAAWLFAASTAFAQTAARPEVHVGDQWAFAVYYTVATDQPGRVWTITSVTRDAIEGTEDGAPLTLTPELNVLQSPQQAESNPRALSFPLEVGKRWRYTTEWSFKPKGSKGTSDVEVVVVAYEKVKVPAGEFDAFRLSSTADLHGTSPINSQYAGRIMRTYWYAPAVRAVVKSESRNPYLGPVNVDLVTFQLRR